MQSISVMEQEPPSQQQLEAAETRRAAVLEAKVYCTLGGAALTVDEFVTKHPHIELGYD